MARTPRLGKTERLSANDEYGTKPSGYYLGGLTYQNDAFSVGSTVNAFGKYAQQMGQKNYRNQLAKGRYNKKRPVISFYDDFYKMPESEHKYKSGKGFKVNL